VRLLRGEAILNVHCYKTEDLEMIMRLSDEFGFKIDSVHHAHEAFQIADELARRNISTALFSDNYAYKMEAIEGSIRAPAILDDAGVRGDVCLGPSGARRVVSDDRGAACGAQRHGRTLARWRRCSRCRPPSIGLAGRVGSLQVGVDADVVIWDRHPLSVGARPDWVSIEGVVVFEQPTPELQSGNVPPPAARWNATTFDCASLTGNGALAIRGARLFRLVGAQRRQHERRRSGWHCRCRPRTARWCARRDAVRMRALRICHDARMRRQSMCRSTWHVTPGFVVGRPEHSAWATRCSRRPSQSGGDGVANRRVWRASQHLVGRRRCARLDATEPRRVRRRNFVVRARAADRRHPGRFVCECCAPATAFTTSELADWSPTVPCSPRRSASILCSATMRALARSRSLMSGQIASPSPSC
jgi:hypothetical protein